MLPNQFPELTATPEKYPFVEVQRIWNKTQKFWMTSFRSEDWCGAKSYADRGGDLNNWNPTLRDLVKEGNVVLDCGANEGWLTTMFANRVGATGRIISIEPVAANCDIIREQVKLNGFQNVEVMRFAVAEKSGELVKLHAECVGYVGETVTTIALDTFAYLRPDVIKVDIEGYELAAIRGAKEILKQHRATWEIEVHNNIADGVNAERDYGFDPAEVFSIFRENNYLLLRDGKEFDFVPEYGAFYAYPR